MLPWALALLAIAAPPGAEPVAIEWTAPAQCPSGDEVRARARQLAVVPADRLRGRASVEARPEGGYALWLELERGSERHLADTCEPLADLAALVIAVAADPVAVATQLGDGLGVTDPIVPPLGSAERVLEPTPRDVSVAPDRPRRTRARAPYNGVIATHAVAGIAQLPRVDAGIDLAVALERGRFAVQARGTWLSATEGTIPGPQRARVQLTAANASLRGCGVWRWSRIDALGCGGIELGGTIGRPTRGATSPPQTSLWVAALASVGMRGWVHPRVALELGADLLIALRRPRFGLSTAPEQTLDAGLGGVRGWAGLAVRLGTPPKTGR